MMCLQPTNRRRGPHWLHRARWEGNASRQHLVAEGIADLLIWYPLLEAEIDQLWRGYRVAPNISYRAMERTWLPQADTLLLRRHNGYGLAHTRWRNVEKIG